MFGISEDAHNPRHLKNVCFILYVFLAFMVSQRFSADLHSMDLMYFDPGCGRVSYCNSCENFLVTTSIGLLVVTTSYENDTSIVTSVPVGLVFGGALGQRLQPFAPSKLAIVTPRLVPTSSLPTHHQGPVHPKEASFGAAPRWCASAYPSLYPHAHTSAFTSMLPRRHVKLASSMGTAKPAGSDEEPRLAGPKRPPRPSVSWVGARVGLQVTGVKGAEERPPRDPTRYFSQLHAKHRLEAAVVAGRAARRRGEQRVATAPISPESPRLCYGRRTTRCTARTAPQLKKPFIGNLTYYKYNSTLYSHRYGFCLPRWQNLRLS